MNYELYYNKVTKKTPYRQIKGALKCQKQPCVRTQNNFNFYLQFVIIILSTRCKKVTKTVKKKVKKCL